MPSESASQRSTTGKAPARQVAATDSQTKKMKKKRRSTAASGLQFRSAIKKCLRETTSDTSFKVTEKTLCILCSIAESLIGDVIQTASELAKKNNKETIGVDDLSTAFELMLSGELRNLCIREIKSVVAKSQSKAAARK